METRFVFVGNRRFVLEAMLQAGVSLSKVFIVKGTHLERDLANGRLVTLKNYEIISSRDELIAQLHASSFDVLVSNGCPYILPIADLPDAQYVNIHPSLLPDLRGYDPVIGSVLYQRDAGATCHIMDDGIDTGTIVSQVPIPYTEDLDVTTLYQLSFIAEQKAFYEALKSGFGHLKDQGDVEGILSYKRREKDWCIDFFEPNKFIMQKIKAFNNHSQGCRFSVSGHEYKVFGIQVMVNPFLSEIVLERPEGEIVFSYEGCVIFHKDGEVLRLTGVQSVLDGSSIKINTNLLGR
jgi:methionyl-tRNA formyltransferase